MYIIWLSFLISNIVNKNKMKHFLICLLFANVLASCNAEDIRGKKTDSPILEKSALVLPTVINDHMVLQQDSKVRIWGKNTPGCTVTVEPTWNGGNDKVETKVGEDGNWCVLLSTPHATFDVHRVKISDNLGGSKTIFDVLVGEVWLCAGQSNMEHPMRGFGSVETGNYQPILNFEEELDKGDVPSFRYFKVNTQIETENDAFDVKNGKWSISSPENSREFQAISYFIGRSLSEKLNVPIGIIGCAYGGTRIEAWMSPESFSSFSPDDYKDAAELGDVKHKSAPSNLWRGMFKPISNYEVRGIVWYQGESNRDVPHSYPMLMASMVKSWRYALHGDAESKPFYFAQLASFRASDDLAAPKIREAQVKALDLIPNSGIVCTIDAGSDKTIHYPNKQAPADRFVRHMLAKNYNVSGVGYEAPRYKKHIIQGNKIIVEFDFAEGLKVDGQIEALEVAGEDKVFYPANAIIEDDKLIVSCDKVLSPKSVRYCFHSWCLGHIYNKDGLPLMPFRTDEW